MWYYKVRFTNLCIFFKTNFINSFFALFSHFLPQGITIPALFLANQQVNRNRGLLVNAPAVRLIAAELQVNGDKSLVNVPMARLMLRSNGLSSLSSSLSFSTLSPAWRTVKLVQFCVFQRQREQR